MFHKWCGFTIDPYEIYIPVPSTVRSENTTLWSEHLIKTEEVEVC